MEVIYGDTYFLVNFSMDLLALFITSKLMKLPFKILRTAASAALGALYALISLMFGAGNSPIGIILSLLMPCLMIYVAFGRGSARSFAINLLTFWVISFLMGGTMTCIYYLAGEYLEKKQIYLNGTVHTLYSGIPPWVFILCALGAAALTVIWNRISDRKARTAKATLSVRVAERTVECEGLVDSGNLLVEPLSALPVIILERSLADNLVPGLSDFGNGRQITASDLTKVRIIPYRTVKGSGIMYGYLPDKVVINGIEKRAVICPSGADQISCTAVIPLSLL